LIFSALLLALLLGGVYSFISLSSANAWLRHTDEVRVRIALLRGTLLDAETGLRGYLFTGSAAFLDPYRLARADWRRELDDVRALTTDNPEQQARLHTLESLIADQLGGFSEGRAVAEKARVATDPLALMQQHKRTMDTARALLEDMENEESELDSVRERTAPHRWGVTAGLFIGGTLVFLVTIALMTAQRRVAEMRRGRDDEERRLLQAVFAGIDDGITLIDRSGKLIFANAGAARMIGSPSPEALLAASGAAVTERFEMRGEDGQPFPSAQLPSRQVLAGSPSARALIRHRAAPSGPWRWSLVNATPITDAAGAVVQAISVFRDVTADRDAEERQRFLLQAVDEISSSLDYERTLASIARLAVPTMADWCAVDIVEDGQLKRLGIAHVDPQKVSFVAELTRRYPPDPASRNGVHEIIRTGELERLEYRSNPVNRCYYCKHELYTTLLRIAADRGVAVIVDGANADDRGDYRPGRQAAREFGVRSPLDEMNLTKAAIRELSRRAGLPTWDEPASACLSSRIPYHSEVTGEKLRMIERAERAVRELGFRVCRVRHHDDLARVEIGADELPKALEPDLTARIVAAIQALGYRQVTIDPRGYRMGSLNEGVVLRPA